MGAAFAYIVYHLASLCGCSEVLVSVLRAHVSRRRLGHFGFILLYMKTLSRTKAILDDKMADMTAEELEYKEEDDVPDDEEEDEEDDDKKKKKKSKPEVDEDDEGEGDKKKKKRKRDDDDDEDEEARPKKRKKR